MGGERREGRWYKNREEPVPIQDFWSCGNRKLRMWQGAHVMTNQARGKEVSPCRLAVVTRALGQGDRHLDAGSSPAWNRWLCDLRHNGPLLRKGFVMRSQKFLPTWELCNQPHVAGDGGAVRLQMSWREKGHLGQAPELVLGLAQSKHLNIFKLIY